MYFARWLSPGRSTVFAIWFMSAALCGVAMCLVYGGFLVLARFVFLVVFWKGICLLGTPKISCKKKTLDLKTEFQYL